jgi:hypothetical protein
MYDRKEMISERLKILLQGRRAFPWGHALGFSSGMISRFAREGKAPGPEYLARICQVERASLSWLLDGAGAPFLVVHLGGDTITGAHLRVLFDDSDWTATWVDGGVGCAVVLTKPDSIGAGHNRIDYTSVKVVAGVLGAASVAALPSSLQQINLCSEAFARLSSAQMGNLELLRALAEAKPVRIDAIAETLIPYDLTAAEVELLADYHALAPRDRRLARQLLRRLVHRVGGEESDLN